MKATLCPNCNGQGTVSRPPWVAGDQMTWVSSGTGFYTCPTCKGFGYIMVPEITTYNLHFRLTG